MKKVTIVLTITALAAALFSAPTHAQSLTSILSKGYDSDLATAAVAGNPTPADAALFAAINAARAKDDEPALTWDPALAAAARYQINDDIQENQSGPYTLLADGTTQVSVPQLASDFGSPATGVGGSQFGNVLHTADTGNWAALVTDWGQTDPLFSQMLSASADTVAGLSVIDSGQTTRSGAHIYVWALLFGHSNATGVSGTLVSDGFDTGLAYAAFNNSPTTSDQSLFAAINAARAKDDEPALTWDPALAAAARYQINDDIQENQSGPYTLLADGTTQVSVPQLASDFGSPATGVGGSQFGNVLHTADTGNWAALVTDWGQTDPLFSQMLSASADTVAGLSVIDSGQTTRSGAHIYVWALLFGHTNITVTTPPPTGPKLNLSQLDPILANQALTAPTTASESVLLAQINATRTFYKASGLTIDPTLEEAAHYQAADEIKLSYLLPLAYLADGKTSISGATLASDFASPDLSVQDYVFNNDVGNGAYLRLSNNTGRMVGIWTSYDMNGFGTMISNGLYNACGIAVTPTGATVKVSGTTYPIVNWTVIVGHHS